MMSIFGVALAAGLVGGSRSLPARGRPMMGAGTAPRAVDAIIVGAGPTGLAAALELHARGARVVIVERSMNPGAFDAEKAFLYNVDGRGQAVLGSLGLLPALLDASVSQEEFRIAIVKDSPNPVGEPVALPTVDIAQRKRTPAQWIPRAKLVELMDAAVAATARQGGALPAIERVYGCELASLEPPLASASPQRAATDGGLWSVKLKRVAGAEGSSEPPLELSTSLVIGADGLGSAVRTQLATLAPALEAAGTLRAADEGSGCGGGKFSVVKRPCASAGLRYKVLTLPPAFRLARTSDARAQPSIAYSLRCTDSAPRPLKAGMLPLRSDEHGRTANFITKEDHPLWEQTTPELLDAYLRATFPHIPLDAQSLGKDEFARFAANRGGHFPHPQHCTDAAFAPASLRGCAAVLAGDALHAFPPDLGQGVNAGLQDVGAFARSLDAHAVTFSRVGQGEAGADEPPAGLAEAVRAYGRARAPEAAAITRLVQLGYPFQYGQEKFLGKLRQGFWAFNLLLRLSLAKVAPALFDAQIFTLVQNPDLAYTEILRRANRTTRHLRLIAVSLLVAAGALWRVALLRAVLRL